jgi:hypothetical protein
MNTRISAINRLAFACALSVSVVTGFVQHASGQCCLTLPAAPNDAISVSLSASQPNFPSQLAIVVNSAPAPINPGTYVGWCAEHGVTIGPYTYTGEVFSSCDPNINTLLANELGAGNYNWPAVNYILNHKGSYSSQVVQGAIWYFVGTPVDCTSVNPNFPPSLPSCNPLTQDALNNYAAWAAAGHPKCGDIVAAVLLFDNGAVAGKDGDTQMLMIEVSCTCSEGNGDAATIGFWRNPNGTKVVNALNCGGSSTALGDWFQANFGCMFPFGGKTDAQVETIYGNTSNSGVQNNTYIQAFAVALACYTTSSTLSGSGTCSSLAALLTKYGFNSSAGGTGSKTFNIGLNGTALGLVNHQSYTIAYLLQFALANYNCGTGLFFGGDSTKTSALNNILNGINQGGGV